MYSYLPFVLNKKYVFVGALYLFDAVEMIMAP